MPRVLVVNNYPLDRVAREVAAGTKPDHHLYGVNYFARRGYEVVHTPAFARPSQLAATFGDIRQQIACLRARADFDLLYSASPLQIQTLAMLRGAGLFAKPIVLVTHESIELFGRLRRLRSPLVNLMLRGIDRVACLSRKSVVELAARGTRGFAMTWGPDKNFYTPDRPRVPGVVTAGRTFRDVDTLVRAATIANVPLRLICGEHNRPTCEVPPNVTIEVRTGATSEDYRELLPHFAAAVHAIPLTRFTQAAGLTSLCDALGSGRAVLMTRNPFIDVDLEGLGIGRLIEPYDVHGWAAALRWCADHPDEVAAMGTRARAFVDAGFHSETFASELADLFDQALA